MVNNDTVNMDEYEKRSIVNDSLQRKFTCFIWKRTSQGYSTMEALRRDTFEDASSLAVDEFELAVTSEWI